MDHQKALITGANGFVGSRLCFRLVKEGWQVDIVIRQSSSLKSLEPLKNKLNIFLHDGSTNSMMEIVEKSAPEVVFHLASCYIAEHKAGDLPALINSNIYFGTQLLEAMSFHQIPSLINTGTAWQHFNNLRYSPVNLYAATKQAFESMLQYYVEVRGLKAITLKLSDTYGPDDPRKKLIPYLIKISRTNESLPMSPGNQIVDYVYIDDVIQALIVSAKMVLNFNESVMLSYMANSDERMTLKKFIRLVEKTIGKSLNITWEKRNYREREMMTFPDIEKRLPSWEPKTKLKDGIKKTFYNHFSSV